ncbi:MAG: histidine phosphatase family protein [Gemmata sp.]
MLVRTITTVAACLCTVGCAGAKPNTHPARVLIIRHAEKPDDQSDRRLSATGKNRAAALHELFEKSEARPEPFPRPEFIFAAGPSKNSDRSEETVAPLAKRLGLKLDARFGHESYDALAKELLGNPKYAGKTVLICWHHGNIPELAQALGYPEVPDKWKDGVFDRVWEVTYTGGKAMLHKRPQALLPGDAKN